MGGQGYKYNMHYSVFNQNYLTAKLKDAGFIKVELWEPNNSLHHNFDDWASMSYDVDGKKFKISLNLEAVK